MTDDKTQQTQSKRRGRPVRSLILVEVTEDMKTKQPCFAVLPIPPFADDGKSLTPVLINIACQNAVYNDGRKEYGNKQLAVVQVLSTFTVPFVERLALTPPDEKSVPDK